MIGNVVIKEWNIRTGAHKQTNSDYEENSNSYFNKIMVITSETVAVFPSTSWIM